LSFILEDAGSNLATCKGFDNKPHQPKHDKQQFFLSHSQFDSSEAQSTY
jgi:hypothetical protein